MLTLLVILTVVCIISIILNVLLAKALSIHVYKLDVYEQWILSAREQVEKTYSDLKFIDEQQIFEKDDDVGFVFTNILELIKNLNQKIYDEDSDQK